VTRVKICGITRAEDARAAAAAGASAIGLVFWPRSPRAVTAGAAREIVAAVPAGVPAIGVFVNQSIEEINDTVERAGLFGVQLHGDEPVDTWTNVGRPIVKALTLATYAASPWLDVARAILLDAHDPQRRGGTGVPIDWDAAAAIAHRRPVILAGGLTADNVGEAVARVRPAALDVASGVEQSPGLKSPARLRAFFDAVRQADARVGDAAPADKEHA